MGEKRTARKKKIMSDIDSNVNIVLKIFILNLGKSKIANLKK